MAMEGKKINGVYFQFLSKKRCNNFFEKLLYLNTLSLFFNFKYYIYNLNKFERYISNNSNLFQVDNNLLDALIGDILGDGHIRIRSLKNGKSSARIEFTFSTVNLPYLRYLKYVVYKEICTTSDPTA